MKKKRNKKRKSSKTYEKPIDSYLKGKLPYLKKYGGGGMMEGMGGDMAGGMFDASSAALMATTTDAVAGMLSTIMGKSNVPKVFDYSPNQNPIMKHGGVTGDPPYKRMGDYQTSFHPKDTAYFEKMQKRFPEAYEASKSQYLLPGMHEVGTESVYKDDSYNPIMETDNIVNEDKFIINSGGRYIPRTANQKGMYNFDIENDQIMIPKLSALDKRLYKKSLKKYAHGTGMQGVQGDPPPRKSLGKYTARVSSQDQKFYDRIQKKSTPEAWQAIQGQYMTSGEYDLGQEDVYEGYDYNPTLDRDNVTTKPKYFATSGDFEYPQSIINDQKGLSNYNVTEDGFLDVAPLRRKGKESDVRKIRQIMRKYAKGGIVQAPNVEVEGGEAYELPNGEIGVIEGDKHTQDTDGDGQYGEPRNVPKGTKFYSAQIKKEVDGVTKTMAEAKIAREKELDKAEAVVKERPFDIFAKNALIRLKEKHAIIDQADMAIQESANMLEQGEQVAQYMKNGGTFKYKYATGGSTGNMFDTLLGLGTDTLGGMMGAPKTSAPTSTDETPVEPVEKESFKMSQEKVDPFYDNWKNKQPALKGIDGFHIPGPNAFNTNLNLGRGDVDAGFQYNIPKSNSYIKGNLNQQLTPLFTEGRLPSPTGSLEGYYENPSNTFDITGKLNTDFQSMPTGSLGVNINPSDKLSAYGNLNIGKDFGMNAGLNWNPSDKFSTGLDLNVNQEGFGIEGTGEYKVNPNLTLGATGKYNTGEGFTGDANLKYTFDRNKKENPRLFANGGMLPKYQHGGSHLGFNFGGVDPLAARGLIIDAQQKRQDRAQNYLPTDWNVDQMLNERFGGDVRKLQQHIVDTQQATPGVFGGYSMGKFGPKGDGVDNDFGDVSKGFFDDPDRKAALAKSLGYSTLEEGNPYGAQPGLYSEANMGRLIHPDEMTIDKPGEEIIPGNPWTMEDPYQETVQSDFPNLIPKTSLNITGGQQGLNIAESSSYPETLEAQRIMGLQGKDFNDASFDLKLNRLAGSNPIPFKDLSKEQQRAKLIEEGKITEESTPRQVAAATDDATEKDGTDSTSTSLGANTRGNRLGELGTLVGGFGPLLTTIIEGATDTPNVNAYLNYGKDQINYLEAQKGMLGINRDKALADMGLASDTTRKRARNSVRGVNQQIALNQVAGAQRQRGIEKNSLNYWNQLGGINAQIGAAKTQRDRMVMAGEQLRDENDRKDKGALFTNLADNAANLGTMYQKLGKDMNTRQTQKEELEIINMMSKYIDIKKDKNGNWEYYDKNGVSMSQNEARKLIKKEKDKVEKEKIKLDKQIKKEKKNKLKSEKWDFFGPKFPNITDPIDYSGLRPKGRVEKNKKLQKGAWNNLFSFD